MCDDRIKIGIKLNILHKPQIKRINKDGIPKQFDAIFHGSLNIISIQICNTYIFYSCSHNFLLELLYWDSSEKIFQFSSLEKTNINKIEREKKLTSIYT